MNELELKLERVARFFTYSEAPEPLISKRGGVAYVHRFTPVDGDLNTVSSDCLEIAAAMADFQINLKLKSK